MADELTIKGPEEMLPRSTGIIWGPAKTGKTTLLSSLPGKKLIINMDPDGHEAVGYRDDISVLDLAKYESAEIVGFSRDKVPSLIKATEDFGPGDSVISDSLSSLGWAALNKAIKDGVGKTKDFTPSLEAPGLTAYGARTNYIVDHVRKLLRVTAARGMHCWFTAHMDTPTTDKQGVFLYQTMTLSDNGVNQTSLSISEVWFIDYNNNKRVIAISPCRGRKPMGSRMFGTDGDPEFTLSYDIDKPDTQLHSMSTMWRMYIQGGRKKLPLPDSKEYLKLYQQLEV